MKHQHGITLIELIVVIAILGVLAITALPRFINFGSDAKIASLDSVASQIEATVQMVKAKALVKGLRVSASNPGDQVEYLVDFGFGRSEVDWRNLCPESRAELGDNMQLSDFIDIGPDSLLSSRVNNQYTLIGFELPSAGQPTDQGCYLIYDSFGDPICNVTVVTVDC